MAKENETKPGKEREDYIKQLIAGNYAPKSRQVEKPDPEVNPEQEYPPTEQEIQREPAKEVKRKRDHHVDYESLFLCESDIKVRKGTYIADDFYKKIIAVIQLTGNNDRIGVSNYINNVLKHHFESYEEAIQKAMQGGFDSIMNK